MNTDLEKSEEIRKVTENRYLLTGTLGSGGMGDVYLVTTNDDRRDERALKIVKKDELYTSIETLKKLNHPGLVRILKVFEDDAYLYIIEEYVEGNSLRSLIDSGETISTDTKITWMKELASALSYLNGQGLVHRDVKPTNIMITPEGRIKLIDYGLVKKISDYDQVDIEVIGTRNYTAPERYEGRPAGIRGDVFGFGATSYFLLTGKKPVELVDKKAYREITDHLKDVSPDLKRIVSKSLHPRPSKRFRNFDQISSRLESINSDEKKPIRVALIIVCIAVVLLGILLLTRASHIDINEVGSVLESAAQVELSETNLRIRTQTDAIQR